MEDETDSLLLPSPEVLRQIEKKQDEQARAAEIIQRNFRGHRERRALKGGEGGRWVEV